VFERSRGRQFDRYHSVITTASCGTQLTPDRGAAGEAQRRRARQMRAQIAGPEGGNEVHRRLAALIADRDDRRGERKSLRPRPPTGAGFFSGPYRPAPPPNLPADFTGSGNGIGGSLPTIRQGERVGLAHQRAVEEVHRADEIGDEAGCRPLVDLRRRSRSAPTGPRFITAMR